MKYTGDGNPLTIVLFLTPAAATTIDYIISKIEDDIESYKRDLSEIKTMTRIIINRTGTRIKVARLTVPSEPPESLGGLKAYVLKI